MTADLAVVDVEGGVRDWLRTRTDVQTAAGGQHVYFGIPDRTPDRCCIVSRVGGGEDTSEAPIDQALIQLDCRAETKALALTLAATCANELRGIRTATVLKTGVVALGAVIESVIWLPDPSDSPRYVVTAAVTARAA